MRQPATDRIRAWVVRDFPGHLLQPDHPDALDLLESLDLISVDGPLDRERIQAAILILAGGDVDRLLTWAAVAEMDWRDVLVNGGLASGDWRDVLAEECGRRGI